MPRNGFTLIEFLMVALIVGIISVVISQILFEGYKNFLTAKDIDEVSYQGWLAVQRISEDVHRIRSANDITTISSSVFTFTDVNGTSVTYQLSGSLLNRNSQTLASGISTLNFTYLNSAGATTSTPSAVRYVKIAVTAVQGSYTASFVTLAGTRMLP